MGYPEWVRHVPAKDLPWNEEGPPEYFCEHCNEFGTDNADNVEFTKYNPLTEEWTHFKCPVCGGESRIDW